MLHGSQLPAILEQAHSNNTADVKESHHSSLPVRSTPFKLLVLKASISSLVYKESYCQVTYVHNLLTNLFNSNG